ncbi:MAG TPA: hypothetical protein VNX70_01305 [Bryobacteraceae bacterium]|nr:hypothetical protein [Bryobacteraceae bacterium]
MDAFKLAFETVIIGLFALPWLWVMIDLVNPDLFNSSGIKRVIACIPAELRSSAIGLALFSMVYLLGSMITPVAREFLNDKDMLGRLLPTEEKIQAANYVQMGAQTTSNFVGPARIELVHFPDAMASSDGATEFQHEESTLLLRGTDDCARLNRLHEQRTVLEGATFSAFALMALCGFAWCGRFSKDPTVAGWKLFLWQEARRWAAFIVASAMILLAGWEISIDSHHLANGDMPIAELVLLLLGGFGLYILIWGSRSRLKFHGLTFVCASWFTMLCYTGYGCTERSYDQEVFYTYRALSPAPAPDSTQAPARPAVAASLSE